LRGWRIGFVSASVQFLLEGNALSDTKKANCAAGGLALFQHLCAGDTSWSGK
jgi:hypothetical protein